MKYLLPGNETTKRVELLISLTRIESEPLIKALNQHLVNGKPENSAAILNGIPQPNFSRAMVKLNKVAETVEAIKELDWAHINKSAK